MEYTTVRPARGGKIHAVALSSPTYTTCGRKFSGWVVVMGPLACRGCKARMHLPVKV